MGRIKDLFVGLDVATVVVSDNKPHSNPVFLVARTESGELLAFRSTAGGMGY
jgi:hypothetical protein